MSRPWMPFYVDRYLGDTTNLNTLEHGAYLLLILSYWRQGGLPDDDEELAAICRLSMPDWQKARRRLSKFFHDGWKHKRIDEEIRKAGERYEKRAAAGKAGGIAKANAKQTASQLASNEPSNATAETYQLHSKEEDSSSRGEDAPSSEPVIKEVRRDQVSPNDPVLARPDDPLAAYSDVELKGLTFEFDGMDIESAIRDLDHWATKKGITDPIERKSAIYGAMKKRTEKQSSWTRCRLHPMSNHRRRS